ncbi:hypothetical protein ILP92_18090 [Maribius pontilimi]|uniref:Cupin domain-containing protein n=1 Tax=Palleronia pontilimi TaxID=1964209 RepID=A0A934IHV6_9RHOB|nr:hypothetical protein [Palleronia pontilimi]MBJ3764647.1 hypothetical protein [Palleronia pontilimi]
MKFVKIIANETGTSKLVDERWSLLTGDFTPPSPAGYRITETLRATGLLMMHHPAGYRDAWHCAPQPVLGTVLSGTIRIETSDGDVRRLSPGDQFLAADLQGAGHKIEETSGAPYDLALVLLDGVPESTDSGAQE